MYRPIPLGLRDDLPSADDGTAAYGGANVPGPLGTVTDQVSSRSGMHPSDRTMEAPFDGSISLPFSVGGDMYRLRKPDSDWRPTSIEVAVPPEEAGAIIERAILQHRKNVPLVRLLETAASQLAGLHEGGTIVLVWLRPQPAEKFVPTPALPAPLRRPAPIPELPTEIEEPMMAAVQAATLKNAAELGVPFCEECARAAAERAAQTA